MNDERLKFNSTFKQFVSWTIQNLIVIISQINNKNQYIIYFIFSISNFISLINNFSTFSNNLNFNFNFNVNMFTSISIDELIIDFILQKIKLFNLIDVKQKILDRHSKFWFFKNFFVNSLIDLIVIEKIVFVKTNSIIVKTTLILFVKTTLILFVKTTLMNFYKSKSYKKIIIDVQHKMNW